MFKFIYLENPDEIKSYIDLFDAKESTWIVSDLKSKLDIQNKCIVKNGYFLDDSILRVSDFWKLWLRRLQPELNVVSHDFIKILTENFMMTDAVQQLKNDLGFDHFLENHQYSTLYKYLNELAPIILSPHSDQIIQEWIKTNNKTWYKWYLLSRLCINYLVYDKKIIDSRWISSLLQSADYQLIKWNKHIYLDLGSEMTSVEMSLFQTLSQKNDVTVFVPDPIWKDKYKFLLNTYTLTSGYAVIDKNKSQSEPFICEKSYKRFSTEALEIKYITSQIRSWIDSGIQFKNIGIVSPRIEEYWPVLKIHLDAEGIIYNKKTVAAMISLGYFQNLLSKINSLSASVDWENLEQAYYSQYQNYSETQMIEFEKFKSQFIELTDADDLVRIDEIKKIFYHKINLKEKISRIQFLALVFKIGITANIETNESDFKMISYLEIIFKDFLASTTETDLVLKGWISIFISCLVKKEITLDKAHSEGLEIGSGQSNHLLDVEHIIWFGLDDSGFKKNTHTMVPLSDIEELKYVFDFPLSYPEESHTEFNIQWLSQSNFKNQIFTCSQFSLKAEPLNTSTLLLEKNTHPDVIFNLTDHATQIDLIQHAQSELNQQHIDIKIRCELGESNVVVDAFKPTELSMTDFTYFDHCGFKLLAAKGFKLKDFPAVSLDLDPRQRGSITHALFEYLIVDKKYKSFDSNSTMIFLNSKRLEYKLYINLDEFWTAQSKKLIEVAKKFCEFENDRIGQLAVNHLVESEFKLKLKKMTISGRIDRMDTFDDHSAIIYDYKRSKTAETNYGINWIDKKEYQMLFYIMAVDFSFSQTHFLQDKGAFYFYYKKFLIHEGVIDESSLNNINIEAALAPTKTARITSEAYQNLKLDFKNIIDDIENKIHSGIFSPIPYKTDICSKCDWNTLCRAPHL